MSEKPDSEPDLLESLIDRVTGGTSDRLDRQMHNAPVIKMQEEEASQRRLENMWSREAERQQTIAEAQSEKQRQEELLVRSVLAVAAACILIVIILATVLSLAG